jgi:hypothetical protein
MAAESTSAPGIHGNLLRAFDFDRGLRGVAMKLRLNEFTSVDSWYIRKLLREHPNLAKYILDGVVCKGRRIYWRGL